jgi:hypothetical protein
MQHLWFIALNRIDGYRTFSSWFVGIDRAFGRLPGIRLGRRRPRGQSGRGPSEDSGSGLVVVVSDISRGRMLRLPWEYETLVGVNRRVALFSACGDGYRAGRWILVSVMSVPALAGGLTVGGTEPTHRRTPGSRWRHAVWSWLGPSRHPIYTWSTRRRRGDAHHRHACRRALPPRRRPDARRSHALSVAAATMATETAQDQPGLPAAEKIWQSPCRNAGLPFDA